MITDKHGRPLGTLSEKRDEVLRCITAIGWSWQKLADRLEQKLPYALRVNRCKVALADSDMRWLQALADAVEAIPRPEVTTDPEPGAAPLLGPVAPVPEWMLAAPAPAAAPASPAQAAEWGLSQPFNPNNQERSPAPVPPAPLGGMTGDMMAQVRAEIAEQSATAVVSAITTVYMAAMPGAGPDAMTTEQVAGARWALGELANAMGLLDLVQDQLQAFNQQRSGQVGGAIGAGVPVSAESRQPL
jgi:hypothetical protein